MDIFLFVLSYLIQLIASAILLYRIWNVRSVHGLSVDTQWCLLSSTISRCIWTFKTRIVEDSLWFTIVAVFEILASTIAATYLVHSFRCLRHTTTRVTPTPLSAVILIPLALLVASIVNPGKWFNFSSQILVAFTMFVEAIALVPQLWLVRKIGDIEALTSHYIGLLVIARVVRMLFWVFMLFDGQWFLCLFLADLLHTGLSADYLYLWIRKLRHGGRLVYSL